MSNPDDPNQDEAKKQTERKKALDEQMEALGHDPNDPVVRAKFEETISKIESERIGKDQLGREMEDFYWEREDRQRREDAKRQSEKTSPGQHGNDLEAEMHVYSKELEEELKTGRIDEREKTYRERRFENQLAMASKSPEDRLTEVPLPRQEPQQQTPLEDDHRKQDRQQMENAPIDVERMISDHAYRKEIEQQAREQRAAKQQSERTGGRERQGSGGREY